MRRDQAQFRGSHQRIVGKDRLLRDHVHGGALASRPELERSGEIGLDHEHAAVPC